MWLFTGRYRELGTAICLISLVVASLGSIFLVVAARLIRGQKFRTGKLIGVLLTAIAVGFISVGLGSAEQVFVPPLSLNRGIALFGAIAGIFLGFVGMILPNRTRLLRVLLLAVAAGVLFGDLTGWLLRSAGRSKYDFPAGKLHVPDLTGSRREFCVLMRGQGLPPLSPRPFLR
jgi:hypothetical protein